MLDFIMRKQSQGWGEICYFLWMGLLGNKLLSWDQWEQTGNRMVVTTQSFGQQEGTVAYYEVLKKKTKMKREKIS